MSDRQMPTALKVFLCSLLGGAGGTYGAFRLVVVIVDRFFPRVDPMIVWIFYVLVPLSVGMASAVTAGVIAGKSLKS